MTASERPNQLLRVKSGRPALSPAHRRQVSVNFGRSREAKLAQDLGSMVAPLRRFVVLSRTRQALEAFDKIHGGRQEASRS
jgi:hypothetical protein